MKKKNVDHIIRIKSHDAVRNQNASNTTHYDYDDRVKKITWILEQHYLKFPSIVFVKFKYDSLIVH